MSIKLAARRAILDEALEIASRVGLQALTVGSLARQAQMSKSGLFAHFGSKEALQLEVLTRARVEFIDDVVRPALAVPRGEPRVRELFERWLARGLADSRSACVFLSAGSELSDQPGPVRDRVVADHRDLRDSIAQAVRVAVAEGHFHPDTDAEQFAHDLYGVMLAFHYAHRLMNDPAAQSRTRRAFEQLVASARAGGDTPTS
jgi:AcrR family transcriptional regulator